MDENPWNSSAEEYRAVQGMVREGRYREAVDRARRALEEGYLGRKHAARLHSQICWIYTEQLQETVPAAIMHGEEAVRLAELAGDRFIRADALCRLVQAYCRSGDIERARAACEEVARAVDQNDSAIVGGMAELLSLEATIHMAAGEDGAGLQVLARAEGLAAEYPPGVGYRIRLQRLMALLEYGRYKEARRIVEQGPPTTGEEPLEWSLARAWLATVQGCPADAEALIGTAAVRAREAGNLGAAIQCMALQALVADHAKGSEASGLARKALERCVSSGRIDLARSLRRRLGRLLAV